MNDAVVKRIVANLPLRSDVHHDAHRQPVRPRVQRTQVIGYLFREHRNHAVWKVHRCTATTGFDIRSGIGSNKVRDVGDVNSELEASVLKDFNVDGIVKIARGRGIDRDRLAFPEVVPAEKITFAQRVGKAGGFFLNLFREGGRKSEFPDNHLRLDVWVI